MTGLTAPRDTIAGVLQMMTRVVDHFGIAADHDAAALMIGIYALTNRIRLSSSARVVESADAVARIIMDAYLSPNMTLQEVRNRWVERHIDPLRDFSEACREELRTFGKF